MENFVFHTFVVSLQWSFQVCEASTPSSVSLRALTLHSHSASYIICGAQVKMKMQSPYFKEQKKASCFLKQSLSSCYCILYLPVNVALPQA